MEQREKSFKTPDNIEPIELLTALIDSAEDIILSKTPDGIIMSWNKAAERQFGYRADEIIGQSVLTLVPPERYEEESLLLQRLQRGERIERYETVRLARDGSVIDVSLTLSPIIDPKGEILGSSTILHDITVKKRLDNERRLAEKKLEEDREVINAVYKIGRLFWSELDLQKLVQAITDAATELTGAEFGSFFYNVYDDEGESYTLYTLSGVPPETFANFPMPRNTDLFGPTFRGEGTIRIEDVKRDPRYGNNPPYHGMPAGHLPVSSYLATPVVGKGGKVIGGLFFGHSESGVFNERHERIVEGLGEQAAIAMENAALYEEAQKAIKERDELIEREKNLREAAEVANRAKDEFLGLLSHELRTPLNSILGWSSTFKSHELNKETLATALDAIDRSARQQARLIEDMLDVSRIVSGKLRLDTQPVDLTSVINSSLDTVRAAAEAKGIRVYPVLGYGEGLVLGDPMRLQQVIWNLLSNAIKFTPKQGSVSITLERVDSHFDIVVSDSGPGIEESFLPYLFERFRQADSSVSRNFGGLGLGLSIVKHIVELHGGTVIAANRKDGTGAIFTVRLPIMAVRDRSGLVSDRVSQVPDDPVTPRSECPPELSGISVLVVDDEADARVMLSTFLDHCGATATTCSSAEEALEILKTSRPDVLVSDIGMPGQDGFALIQKIRASEAATGDRLPAIALTAYARTEDRMRAIGSGYNMHVPKPVEPAELALVIASLTGKYHRSPGIDRDSQK